MTDWTDFAENLAIELPNVPETSFLVISERDPAASQRYAQFHITEDRLVAELAGDAYLEPQSRPDTAGWRAITRAGWHLPDPDHVDNWWVEFEWPVLHEHYRRVAAMTVTGLRDGFRIAGPADLSYKGWVAQSGNSRLHIPSLGLHETE